MPELDDMIENTPSVPSVPHSSQDVLTVLTSTPTQQTHPSNDSSVNAYINSVNCQTTDQMMAYNQSQNQLMDNLIDSQNAYKSSEGGLSSDQTQLTFSDLMPPVPNISTLESNRLLTVDTSLPTVDGVCGAVPDSKSILIEQMSSMRSDGPSIEIPSNEELIDPKDGQIMQVKNQYQNIFQPIINGPSGSAPQTPDSSPIDSIESSINSVQHNSNLETQPLQTINAFDNNSTTFSDNSVANNVFNVNINQMVPVLDNSNVTNVSSDGPLPVLGIEAALQEQLLDAIPPPSSNFPPGPPPTDESGIPSALPGEFPLSLLPIEEEKVDDVDPSSALLDRIEATINMNANSVPTLTNAVSLTQSTEVNLIKSLPQRPQIIPALQSPQVLHNNPMGGSARDHFNLNYSNCQSYDTQLLLSSVIPVDQQIDSRNQISSNTEQQISEQQSQANQQQINDQQNVSHQESQQQSIGSLSEAQLPPPPAPPSASMAVFESSESEMMSEMSRRNSQLTTVLPPPPPLQSVQNMNQSNVGSLQEINTLTNLVPVVESQTSVPSVSVVIKQEPQSYSDSNDISQNKVNDNNNNPILLNCMTNQTEKEEIKIRNSLSENSAPLISNSIRSFPLCVISTHQTNINDKNCATNAPKYEVTLPPKKAKFGTGLMSVSQSSKMSSQGVPSTGMIYDLPQQNSGSLTTTSSAFRPQSGVTQMHKSQHNISPPFTTVPSLLFTGLMPSVTMDGPLSLVKEDKMRTLMTNTSIANHPDYPAISGLLSFIKPEYQIKQSTTPSMTSPSNSASQSPLVLSIKNSLSQSPLTCVAVNQLSTGPVPSSISRPSLHQNQHNITSATAVLHTPPNAVPVSVVTSVVDHHRGYSHRIKTVGHNKSKASDEHNTTGIISSGSKLQLAPLLSGDPAKPFQCALCGKHLASKNVYQLHLRSHSGEKPFSCTLCGHSFSQKTSLTRHMRSHTGERPFPCQVCGKRFADKERIKIHMRTHTGEKPFSCEICGKQFSQKSTVKRHMSVHTGEKPFKCETCGKGFANRGNLTAHTKTHSNS